MLPLGSPSLASCGVNREGSLGLRGHLLYFGHLWGAPLHLGSEDCIILWGLGGCLDSMLQQQPLPSEAGTAGRGRFWRALSRESSGWAWVALTLTFFLDVVKPGDGGLCEGGKRGVWAASGPGRGDRTHLPCSLVLFRLVTDSVVTTEHSAVLVVRSVSVTQ